ncbi:MAG: hypothetical protein Q9208_008506 [Pyrenodesmia sp. 3 TL-2023]
MAQLEATSSSAQPATAPADTFPLMDLPPVLRRMVYQEHFASLRRTHPSQSNHTRTALLLVSKTIYKEAVPEYYMVSRFDTSGPVGDSWNWDPDDVEPPLPKLPYPYVYKVPGARFRRDFNDDIKARLNADVAKIFCKYKKDLPRWLFGAPYLRNARNYWKVRRPLTAGWSFARFLRQIGPVNAGEIGSLRISSTPGEFFHLLRACWELPLVLRDDIRNANTPGHAQRQSAIDYLEQHGRHAMGLGPTLAKDLRGLILDNPSLRSLVIKGGCACIPPDYLQICHGIIQKAFRERSRKAAKTRAAKIARGDLSVSKLRHYIYKYALIAAPAEADESTRCSRPRILKEVDQVPTPSLLRVSKQINLEASPILYACNTFSTCNLPEATLRDPRSEGKQVWQWTNDSGECHPVIVEAVSTIFNEGQGKIGRWLAPKLEGSDQVLEFTDLRRCAGRRRGIDELLIEGLPLTSFLRTIGASNTLQITRIELAIGDIPEAVDLLVLYAEIFKQHMIGVKNIVIDFGCEYNIWRLQGGEDNFDFDTEGWVYQATHMMPLFYVLQGLIQQLPRLRLLKLDPTGCSSEMIAMIAALMDEKRKSVLLDVWQKWSDLLEEARKRRGSKDMAWCEDRLRWIHLKNDMDYSVWEDISLLEDAHHGRIKIDSYL